MAQRIIYICDLTGKESEERSDFCQITILSVIPNMNDIKITKFVHKDKALELGFRHPTKEEVPMKAVTVEQQFIAALTEYVQEIAQDAAYDTAKDAIRNN